MQPIVLISLIVFILFSIVFNVLVLIRMLTPYGVLHPMLAVGLLFQKSKKRAQIPVLEQRSGAIKQSKAIQGKLVKVESIYERAFPGPGGDIHCLMICHNFSAHSPVILFFHGGGFAVGHPRSYEHIGRYFSQKLGALFIIPDYRLAPEHPFPAAVEDAYAVLEKVYEEYPEHPIIVMGDSAGGNLATVVSVMARDRKGPHIQAQVLNYPLLHIAKRDYPSYEKFGTGYYLEKSDIDWFAQQYAPDPGQQQDPGVSPLLTPDLSRLPPALIITAQFDALHDEAEVYRDKLLQAGNEVGYSEYKGMVHGFFSMAGLVRQARQAWDEVILFMREIMGQSE